MFGDCEWLVCHRYLTSGPSLSEVLASDNIAKSRPSKSDRGPMGKRGIWTLSNTKSQRTGAARLDR